MKQALGMANIKTREEAMAKVRDDLAHFQLWIKKRNAPVRIPHTKKLILIIIASEEAENGSSNSTARSWAKLDSSTPIQPERLFLKWMLGTNIQIYEVSSFLGSSVTKSPIRLLASSGLTVLPPNGRNNARRCRRSHFR